MRENVLKLHKVVMNAIKNVPFYKEYNNDLEKYATVEEIYDKLPIIDKENYRHSMEEFISRECNTKDLRQEFTSGSSGEPFKCYKSLKDSYSIALSVTMARRRADRRFRAADKYVRLYGSWTEKNISKNALLLSVFYLDDQHIEEYMEAMVNFQPKWLMSTPSMLEKLYLVLKRNPEQYDKFLLLDFYFIELNGEILKPEQKVEFEEFFRCKIINLYGCREMWQIATSCSNNNLHIDVNNVYVEVIDEYGESVIDKEGEIIVTGLNNYDIPFIKYRIGDIGKINMNKCSCGCSSPIIQLSGGRISEHIILNNGDTLNSVFIHHIFRKLNEKGTVRVKKYFVKQLAINEFKFFLSVDDSTFNNDMEQEIIARMKSILGDEIKVFFEYEYQFELMPSGKSKNFESYIEGGN